VHCRVWCSALVVMAVVVWSWDASCVHCEGYCSTVSVHTLVRLMMGIMMPKTCWDKSFDNKHQISCTLLVSLSSPYVHDARSQKPTITAHIPSSINIT